MPELFFQHTTKLYNSPLDWDFNLIRSKFSTVLTTLRKLKSALEFPIFHFDKTQLENQYHKRILTIRDDINSHQFKSKHVR